MAGCVSVDILIKAQQQRFFKAPVFVMVLQQLIFLDTGRSCERSQLSLLLCWLLEVSGHREITFKGLHTYYRAVSGAAGGHWRLCGGATFKDKTPSRRSEVDRLTQPASDRSARPPPAAPWTDSVGAVTSPAVTIRPARIRLKSRKAHFPLLKNPDVKCWLAGGSTCDRRSLSSCLPHSQRTIRRSWLLLCGLFSWEIACWATTRSRHLRCISVLELIQQW